MDSQDEPTVVCSNCDRAIAESKSFLHEAYCFRNIIRCSKCNEPINKNEVDAHDKENHNLVPCKHCRKDFEAKLLGNHVENCPQKPKFCQFCKCEISSEEFLDHIYQCGSRTRQCAFCNKSILVRDLESHEAACEVEQFTRQEAGLEENTFEDSLDLPPRREAVPETRSIPRKRFEPVKKELNEQNKKRLTKLSNKRGSLEEEGIEQISNEEFDVGVAAGTRRQRGYERQKTQEELDEEMARELNDEYYHGKNPNKKKINEKSRSKAFQDQDDDFIDNGDIEEEFFGTKKERRITRLDKKKTVEENEFSNGSRRNAPTTRNAKRQTKNQPTYTYDEEDENYNYEEQEEEEEEAEYSPMVETRGGTKKTTGQRQNEIDPEMHQFYDDGEDAELQRAIQASLESFQN